MWCVITATTPTTTPQPGDVTGQPAIDQMTNELKGGRWRYFTSSSQSSTVYVLNLCADGTFLRTVEAVGVQTFRYGTWSVTDAVIFGDGSGPAARPRLKARTRSRDLQAAGDGRQREPAV